MADLHTYRKNRLGVLRLVTLYWRERKLYSRSINTTVNLPRATTAFVESPNHAKHTRCQVYLYAGCFAKQFILYTRIYYSRCATYIEYIYRYMYSCSRTSFVCSNSSSAKKRGRSGHESRLRLKLVSIFYILEYILSIHTHIITLKPTTGRVHTCAQGGYRYRYRYSIQPSPRYIYSQELWGRGFWTAPDGHMLWSRVYIYIAWGPGANCWWFIFFPRWTPICVIRSAGVHILYICSSTHVTPC